MLLIIGLVAQMVDRRLGMAEAPGSNPGQSIFINDVIYRKKSALM
jgi:hypothetical protein